MQRARKPGCSTIQLLSSCETVSHPACTPTRRQKSKDARANQIQGRMVLAFVGQNKNAVAMVGSLWRPLELKSRSRKFGSLGRCELVK